MAQRTVNGAWKDKRVEDSVEEGVEWTAVFTEDISDESVFESIDRYWAEKGMLDEGEIRGFKRVIEKRLAGADRASVSAKRLFILLNDLSAG
ncbi:MAG: hypothetical protein S4CHLAM2_03710 [Chlamydiales bacterium]|nr:hypothetical protein [Chlamydiales bacterium]